MFQSTRPYGARLARRRPPHLLLGFNPRARMGRDRPGCAWEIPHSVSIHAPVWGATPQSDDTITSFGVFQSTRPYGARLRQLSPRIASRGFNPRARMGRDARCAIKAHLHGVSIHAPVWGATPGKFARILVVVVSIHAPVWGATFMSGAISRTPEFQSTRPYGARLECRRGYLLCRVFQSTRPYGARRVRSRRCCNPCVSIHAPVWGATRENFHRGLFPRVSIHAPVWGATCTLALMRRCQACFNPRARMGRDCLFLDTIKSYLKTHNFANLKNVKVKERIILKESPTALCI